MYLNNLKTYFAGWLEVNIIKLSFEWRYTPLARSGRVYPSAKLANQRWIGPTSLHKGNSSPWFSERAVLHQKPSGDWEPLKGKRVPLIWTLVYLIEVAVRYIQLCFLPFSDSETGLTEISLRKRKKGQIDSIRQLYCVMWQKRRAEELSWKSVVNVLNVVLLSLSTGQNIFTLLTIWLSSHSVWKESNAADVFSTSPEPAVPLEDHGA